MRRVGAAALVLGLAGCGGAGSSTTVATAHVPSAGAASGVASTTASPAPALTGGNPVDPAALCAFLQGDLAAVQGAGTAGGGSAPGALAQLTGDLSVWVEQHAAQKPRTADDLDAAASSGCPQVRTQMVAALGKASFKDAFE